VRPQSPTKDQSAAARREYVASVAQSGKEGVPALIESLHDPDVTVRAAAGAALGRLGPDARAAVPALRDGLEKDPVWIATVLCQIGAGAAQDLGKALADPDVSIRRNAALALNKMGPPLANEAMAALGKAILDDDQQVRQHALHALSRIGEPALPTMQAALADGKAHSKEEVIDELGYFGEKAEVAIPALLPSLSDEKLRQAVIHTLGKIGQPAESALPALGEALKDKDPEVRRAAIVAMGPIGKKSIPLLQQALKDKDLRLEAAAALGLIGKAAAAAVPDLCLLLQDPEPEARRKAAAALGSIGSERQEVIPALMQALTDKEAGEPAMYALARMNKAMPVLIAALRDEKTADRAAATLGHMGKPAVRELLQLLKDEKLRGRAIVVLGVIGNGAREAIPELTKVADDPTDGEHQSAAAALKKITARPTRRAAS